MIEPSLAAALARVADRANDVLHGYDWGFQSNGDDVRVRVPVAMPAASGLSVAAPADCYFMVRKDGKTVFTRDGAFRFDRGELRTEDGGTVLGRMAAAPEALSTLRIDAREAAVRRPRDLRIDPDGSVSFNHFSIDPRSGQRRAQRFVLGRLVIARFPPGTKTIARGEHNVEPSTNVVPVVGTPGDGAFALLRTHVRELAGVDIEAGLRRLQEAYLSLEALQAAYRGNADLEKGAMDLVK